MKAFGGWVFREVGLPLHPLSGLLTPRVPDVLVPSLRDPEMRALLAAAASSKDPLRDQAVVSLLLDGGIRLSELVGIRVGDLDLVEGRCRDSRQGSGRAAGARRRPLPTVAQGLAGRARPSRRSRATVRWTWVRALAATNHSTARPETRQRGWDPRLMLPSHPAPQLRERISSERRRRLRPPADPRPQPRVASGHPPLRPIAR